MRVLAAVLIALLAGPALAQQQAMTPSQLAIQIDTAINSMAQQIEQLQAQNAALQAHIKELEAAAKPAEPAK